MAIVKLEVLPLLKALVSLLPTPPLPPPPEMLCASTAWLSWPMVQIRPSLLTVTWPVLPPDPPEPPADTL